MNLRVTDPRKMRVMAHPVRLALLDALAVHEQLTATQAGELIGEGPSACSFHLRQLAKYGFVEEAGKGPGRERPWRAVPFEVDALADPEDVEGDEASFTAASLMRERAMTRLDQWWATRASFSPPWRRASRIYDFTVRLTADELDELKTVLADHLASLHARRGGGVPDDALPVQLFFVGFPIVAESRRNPGSV